MAKVIEQEKWSKIEISYEEDGSVNMQQRWKSTPHTIDVHCIEKENRREISLAIYDFEKEQTLFINWINENEYRYSRKYKMYQKQLINETLFYSTEELLQIYLTHLNK